MSDTAKPVISVVIDSFNTGDFIGAAIESVIAQTRPADQIIISDASTDNSREIIERHATSERRIKTILRKNRGPAGRRVTMSFDWHTRHALLQRL